MRLALDALDAAHRNQFDVALIFSQDQDLSELASLIRLVAGFQNRWIKIASAFPAAPPRPIDAASTRPTGARSTSQLTTPASTRAITARGHEQATPGELTLEGSPLWEKLASESKGINSSRSAEGVINIVRLNADGSPTARIDYLHCKIEGGFDEWRISTSIPGNLVTLGFSLDIKAMREHPTGSTRMKSTFEYHNHLARFKAVTIEILNGLDQTAEVFGGMAKDDDFAAGFTILGADDTSRGTRQGPFVAPTAALENAGIDYAVIGGNAVAAWVGRADQSAVRFTQDVDLLILRSDLVAATAALETAGFIYRHVASVDLFLDGPDAKDRDAVRIIFAGDECARIMPCRLRM